MTEAREHRRIADIIAAACERQRAGQSHGEAGMELKKIVDAKRRTVALEYARGDIAAEKYAETIDEALRALFAAGAVMHIAAAKSVTLAAVGGYGRGLLAPYSDIDLLVLYAGDEKQAKGLIDFLLYPLWDAGLKVGHAVHTPAGAVKFAESDMTARTAYLDARAIAGDQKVLRDFRQGYDKLRKRTRKPFIAAKEEERAARHAKVELGRFLAEPDLKEGKGGLRDLHFMRWVHKFEHDADIGEAKGKRAFAPEDVTAFKQAERFLWSVRVQLHALRGRAEEKLTFDLQPALAERLGFNDRGDMSAAERLMRRYFMNAMEVGRLSRIFMAQIEEAREIERLSPRALKSLPKTLSRDEAGDNPNLRLHIGRLHFQNTARARKNPIDSFRLFRAYAKRPDFAFHPEALALVAASVRAVTAEVRDDPVIARLFVGSLTDAKDPVRLLRVMAETGLLGAYLRAFGKTIGRTEYGLYRRYSIDESVYRSIGVLAEIIRGEAGEKHPIASQILSRAADPTRYFIALLLHEIGWGMKDASLAAVEHDITRIARRFGLPEEEATLIGWTGARHRIMQETVERRDLSEAATAARFAETVGDRERLDLLLVIAVCHQRVVGAFSWDDWTRRQISMLYENALAYLEGGADGLDRRRESAAREAREGASAFVSGRTTEEKNRQLANLPTAFLKTVEPELIGRIADLVSAAESEGVTAAVSAMPRDGGVEAIVYAEDRTGLLADLAGAISSAGASVRSVQVTTSADGKAIDVFSLQTTDGAPAADADLVRRLHGRLLDAAQRPPKKPPSFSRRIGDRRAIFSVASKVRLYVDASPSSLVVEAEGRDRPGLLYDLCAAFAELGLGIASAHVATYGARAIDAFYVRDKAGRKVTDGARLKAVEARLLAALGDGDEARTPLTVAP